MKKLSALGLPSMGNTYHKLLPEQNIVFEGLKTQAFLRDFVEKNGGRQVQFINYGDTQLVYVMETEKELQALLVGQPAAEFGIVRREFENLRELAKIGPRHVVEPITYYKNDEYERELYSAPYHYRAHCVGAKREWGAWKPDPDYRFEKFTERQRRVINPAMISLLVKLYDREKELGVGKCRIGGGDFILDSNWETDPLEDEHILRHLHLIACRDRVKIPFGEYLDILRREFCETTIENDPASIQRQIANHQVSRDRIEHIVNTKARAAMSPDEIENGIELGLRQ